MHHKFMVFCQFQTFECVQTDPSDPYSYQSVPTDKPYVDDRTDRMSRQAVPATVWTGSFNATVNGTQSLENAVIIADGAIAQAYFDEWCDMIGISEPLDWEHQYVAPEWRFGT
jgi:hypothetical protein